MYSHGNTWQMAAPCSTNLYHCKHLLTIWISRITLPVLPGSHDKRLLQTKWIQVEHSQGLSTAADICSVWKCWSLCMWWPIQTIVRVFSYTLAPVNQVDYGAFGWLPEVSKQTRLPMLCRTDVGLPQQKDCKFMQILMLMEFKTLKRAVCNSILSTFETCWATGLSTLPAQYDRDWSVTRFLPRQKTPKAPCARASSLPADSMKWSQTAEWSEWSAPCESIWLRSTEPFCETQPKTSRKSTLLKARGSMAPFSWRTRQQCW